MPASSSAPPHLNRWIRQARIPGLPGLHRLGIDPQGLIRVVQPEGPFSPATEARVLDLAGDWLSLGGVDLQINGALGLAFPDLTPATTDRLAEVCRFLWQQGIDGFLPTLVTSPLVKIQQALAALSQWTPPSVAAAQILGLHLEGPFLNPQKRGAHPAAFLLPLSVAAVKQLLGNYGAEVKMITLAPELDPTGEAIAYLRQQGIIVSLGHSLATAAEAKRAFAQGASLVTHAFNAMPSLHHREPGLLGAALVEPGVWCGLIADGEHVCPIMLEILLRTLRQGQGLFLVSDALAPLGLAEGVFPWDDRQIQVQAGTARLEDGTLAGTTLPLLAGVENLVHWGLCDVGTAIALATEAPRQAIGLPGLGVGQSAQQLLRWHQDSATGSLNWQRLELLG